ncbi:HEAT repeat domain-containing protein [Gimesia aquarii]|uniref:HEAT repeat protein n=1 Tax=Gimesia aquarii TaxID=2527964 RepID=A0A517VQE8_9PLAN|nr:HEAT repeat domain-containing protein [Gimesia aquarii]QDT95248.1 HEAT repeat protein [Gimesia aquarii]
MDDQNRIIKLLQTFAHRTDPDQVSDAEQAILPSGEAAISALIEALNDPDPDLRIFTLKILEYFEDDTEPALPAMIKALTDSDRNVRICALTPVASFGAKAIDAVPILEKWIGSDDEFRHVSAVGHILMIDSSKAEELVPILLKALESDDFGIRCQTAWLLGQLGKLTEETMPVLERMVNDENSSVRRVASEALMSITY